MIVCYGGCRPECEACRPKHVMCSLCGKQNSYLAKECRICHEPITEKDRELAYLRWKEDVEKRMKKSVLADGKGEE